MTRDQNHWSFAYILCTIYFVHSQQMNPLEVLCPSSHIILFEIYLMYSIVIENV